MMAKYSTIVAVQLDIEFYRGDKVSFELTFWQDEELTIPFNLTPMAGTLKMQIKKEKNSPRAIATLTEGEGLELGANTNELIIETSGNISVIPAANYFYDVEGLYTGDRYTFLKGKVLIEEDVTR